MRQRTRDHDFDERADRANGTPAVIASILGKSKRSGAWQGRNDGAARIERLIRAGARIDAALALIALELPQWQLRRIAYDGGEWHCALSRSRELPDWLDQSAEGQGADLTEALLAALIEAQRITAASRAPSALRPRAQSACMPLCCDNFS